MSHSKDNKEQSNRQDDDPETKSMIWERINAYTTAHDTAIRVMEQNHHGQALEITPPVTDLAVSPQDPALADSPSDNVIHLGERLVRAAAHDTAIRVMEQNHHGQALEITPPVTDLAVSPQDPALADSPSDNVIHLGERLVRAADHGIAGQLEYINWLHDEQLRNGTDG